MRRSTKAAETGLVYVGREAITPSLAWLAAGFGAALPLLPIIKTAYVGFLFTCLVGAWVKWRGEALSDFGLALPRRWFRALAWGVAIFIIVLVYAAILERQINIPLVRLFGPNLGAETFQAVRGNLPAFLLVLPCIWLFAAVGEEFLYRGYLLSRLTDIFGGDRKALVAATILQALLFGVAHLYQGWTGVIDVSIYGLFYGIAARISGRNLVPAIIAHGLLDTLGFTLLYLGLM